MLPSSPSQHRNARISNIKRILWLSLLGAAAPPFAFARHAAVQPFLTQECFQTFSDKIAENTYECNTIIRFSIWDYVTLFLKHELDLRSVISAFLGMCTHIMYITYLLQCDASVVGFSQFKQFHVWRNYQVLHPRVRDIITQNMDSCFARSFENFLECALTPTVVTRLRHLVPVSEPAFCSCPCCSDGVRRWAIRYLDVSTLKDTRVRCSI